MPRKKEPPTCEWRYGGKEEPLFIKEKHGGETFVEFVGPITHQEFKVSIRGVWHTFAFNKLFVYKSQLFDEPWISNIAYKSLIVMAEHVMTAVFASFQPRAKRIVWSTLKVQGHAIRLVRLREGFLVFRYQKRDFIAYEAHGLVFFDGEDEDITLPHDLKRFIEIFCENIWPKLPVYQSREERTAARWDRKIERATPATLFAAGASPVRAPKEKQTARKKVKHPPSPQLSLFV